MYKLLAAAAAIAVAASTAYADPGGNGGGKDRGPAAQVNGNGGGKDRGPAVRVNGNGNSKAERAASAKPDRGPQRSADRGPEMRGPEARGNAERKPDRQEMRQVERRVEQREDRRVERRVDRDAGSRENRGNERVVVDRYRDEDRRVRRVADFDRRANRGLLDGCPPGLAKKNNGCTPPGLLKGRDDDRYRYREAYYRPDWWGYNSLGSNRVYYDDGYLYRLGSNNSVLGYIPLLGGALSIGNPWPSMYQPVPVPNYYVDYYNLGPQGSYRYADDVLYRVDPQTAAITSIAALLTGDEFAVGQPMPRGYDVYNVPYAYQDRYYDRPDAIYRYSDGYVYQVDPTTQLVAAAIELLV